MRMTTNAHLGSMPRTASPMPVSALDRPLDDGGPIDQPATPWHPGDLERPLFARFSAQVERAPEHPAVIEPQRTWTYAELHQRALQIAATLTGSTDPVAIRLPAGAQAAAAVLGALAVGRPYVPLDPAYPAERNQQILQHAGATTLIHDQAASRANASHPQPEQDASAVSAEHIDINRLPLDSPQLSPQHNPQQPPRPNPSADSYAYILYTSGSTGQPKGVYQNQRGLLHDIQQYSQATHIGPDDRLTWLYSPSVNGALRDLYSALLNGATLVPMDARALGLRGLARRVAETGISVFHAIPPLLRAFLQSQPVRADLASVRLAYVAGDRFFASDLERFYHCFPPDCLIYNGIGSTECATLYRHWFINRETQLDQALVPVGYPIPERETRLVDPAGNPVARGAIGEVEVSSPYIALGYWRDPALTQARFTDAAGAAASNARRYRTGDLARERPDGLLEFIGRADSLLKIRGHRVEPGAVEAELRALPGITDAAILVTGTEEHPELTAALSGEPRANAKLREQLRNRCPEASIPTQIHWLEAIPRLPNHKLDQTALRQHIATQQQTPTPPRDPQSEASQPASQRSSRPDLNQPDPIEACWQQILQRTGPVDPTLSFADQGGDSLAILRLLARLEQVLNRSLPLTLVHPAQTLAGLRQALALQAPSIPLYVIPPLTVGYPHLQTLAARLAPAIELQLVPVTQGFEDRRVPVSAGLLGAKAADHIAQHHRTGPVHLIGLSFGTRVAFEAACRLQREGFSVQTLIACDTGPVRRPPPCPSPLTRHGRRLRQTGRILIGREPANLPWKTLQLAKRLPPQIAQALTKAARAIWRTGVDWQQLETQLAQPAKWSLEPWTPGHFAGTLTLLRATQEDPRRQPEPPNLGWDPYVKAVSLVPLQTTHTQLFGPGVIHEVQALIQEHVLPAAAQVAHKPVAPVFSAPRSVLSANPG